MRVSEIDDGATSSHEKEGSESGMTVVSLTLRLNVNKFVTLTYYKPKISAEAGGSTSGKALQKTFMEDFSRGAEPQVMQQR